MKTIRYAFTTPLFSGLEMLSLLMFTILTLKVSLYFAIPMALTPFINRWTKPNVVAFSMFDLMMGAMLMHEDWKDLTSNPGPEKFDKIWKIIEPRLTKVMTNG